jgi:hypothetical protein
MKKIIGMGIMCLAALAFGPAYGHGSPTANHGGVVMAVGETWLELVVRGDTLELYLEDDGDAMDSKGISGKLTIAGKADLSLTPAGGNMLKAKSSSPVPAGAKVAAVLLLADKKTKVATTFTVK